MDSEKTWKVDALLLLAAGLMTGLGVLSAIGLYFQKVVDPSVTNAYTRLDFFLGSFGFHTLALVLAHLFLRHHRITWREFLGSTTGGFWRHTALGLWSAALVLPPAVGLKFLSSWVLTQADIPPEEQAPVLVLQEMRSWDQFLWFGLAAVILAPLVEEILFRGILYTFLKQRSSAILARWISALYFAGFHLNLVTFFSLTLLALVLVWLYEKTRSLYAPILAHAFFNACNFAFLVWQTMAAASV